MEQLKIGNKIKSKRIEKGIKQDDLANELNISQINELILFNKNELISKYRV
jgi:transcriptional regulator with XRE-family HTH domain